MTITFGTGGTSGFATGGVHSLGPTAVPNTGGLLTLTVTAGPSASATISSAATGFGVINVAGENGLLDRNSSTDDRLDFVFSSAVTLTNITLQDWDSGDGGIVTNLPSTVLLSGQAFSSNSLSFFSSGTGFRIEVDDGNDDYRVRSITFDLPLVNPEPSTYLLIGSGLVGLAVLRRRCQKAP